MNRRGEPPGFDHSEPRQFPRPESPHPASEMSPEQHRQIPLPPHLPMPWDSLPASASHRRTLQHRRAPHCVPPMRDSVIPLENRRTRRHRLVRHCVRPVPGLVIPLVLLRQSQQRPPERQRARQQEARFPSALPHREKQWPGCLLPRVPPAWPDHPR